MLLAGLTISRSDYSENEEPSKPWVQRRELLQRQQGYILRCETAPWRVSREACLGAVAELNLSHCSPLLTLSLLLLSLPKRSSEVMAASDEMETTMLSIWVDPRMMWLQCQAMALILGDQAAKDPAAAAGDHHLHRRILWKAPTTRKSWEGRVSPNPRSRKPPKRWTHCYPTAWWRVKFNRTWQTFNVFNSCIFTPLIFTGNAAVLDNDDRVVSDTTANPSLETSVSTGAVSGTNSFGVITSNSISCTEQSTRPWWCSTTYLHNPDAHKVVHNCKVCHMDYYNGTL